MFNTKKPVGNGIKAPVLGTSKGSPAPMSVSYSDGPGDMSSGPNLSKKFKNPQVKQSVPEAGKNQYEI